VYNEQVDKRAEMAEDLGRGFFLRTLALPDVTKTHKPPCLISISLLTILGKGT
jgi:hypothetical protein